MRVDDSTRYQSMLSSIQDGSDRLLMLQKQISTGQRIFKPSDDPVGYQRKDTLETQLNRLGEQKVQLQDQVHRLDLYDSTMGNLVENLRRARSLVLRASNDATDPGADASMAQEANSLLQQSLDEVNQQVAGSYLFGGSKASAPPFQGSGPSEWMTGVSYQGDRAFPGVPLPDGQTMQVPLDGKSVTEVDGAEIFSTLTAVRDQIKSGTVLSDDLLGRLSKLEDNLLQKRSAAGSASRYLSDLGDTLSQRQSDAQAQLESVAGADLPTSITELLQAQTRQQATYSVISQQSRLSLVDYLK